MRLVVVLATALFLTALPAGAQPSATAQSGSAPATSAPAQAVAAPSTEPQDQLPVSLDRIREGLIKPTPTFSFRFDVPPADFRSEVHEQQKLDELMKSLDFRAGPVPAGGLYNYEQQRVMRNSLNPLMQPYAAFSGGELLTISIEALAEKYLGGKAIGSVSRAERARAESAARAEVLRKIADWCAAQPEQAANQPICQNP